MHVAPLIVCALLYAATSPIVHADWSTTRANFERNAVTNETIDTGRLAAAWVYRGASQPQPAWHGPAKWDAYASLADLHSMRDYDVAYEAIIVAGSCYFASSADHAVVCLNAKTGHERWRFCTDAPVRVAPTWYDDHIYFGCDDGHAYCIDVAGKLIWRFSPTAELPNRDRRLVVNNGNLIPLWPVRTGVSVADGTAYFAASLLPWEKSYLCAVDAKSGKPSGVNHFVREFDNMTFEGPLALSRELLIAPQGRVAPMLFARRDGASLGSLSGGGGAYVVVAADEVLHGPGNKAGWMTRSKANTRERVATHGQARAVVVRQDITYLLTKNVLMALGRDSEQPIWQVPVDHPLSMIATGNAIIVGGVDNVAAFALEDGDRLWGGAIGGRAQNLAFSDGTLLVSTDIGTIEAFTPQNAAASPPSAATRTDSSTREDWVPKPPPPTNKVGLQGRWVFQRPHATGLRVADIAGKNDATTASPIRHKRAGEFEFADLSAGGQSFNVTDNHNDIELPKKEFSVTAWVRIDKAQPWGGILSAIQDNGSAETGFLLGYRDNKFCLGVAATGGDSGLTYMTADEAMKLGRWYHVVGTYDGATMRLWVDGRVVKTSEAQQGPITYPDKTPVEIAAYHDSDEYFPLVGAIHEVRLYQRVIEQNEIAEQFSSNRFPETSLVAPSKKSTLMVEVGPWLEFTAPGTARIRWQTAEPTPTHLELELAGETKVYSDSTQTNEIDHDIEIAGLKHNRVYNYRILSDASREGLASQSFECDTFFDYNPPRVAGNLVNTPGAQLASELIASATSPRGICFVYGFDELDHPEDSEVPAVIAALSGYRIHWFVRDEPTAQRARMRLAELGAAARVSVRTTRDDESVQITPRIANLIVVNDECDFANKKSIKSLLAPGGVAIFGTKLNKSVKECESVVGTPLPGSGDWTHAYGRADNSAFGGEQLGGIDQVNDLALQWLGRPGPRYQSDRQNRNSPPLAIGGRLFMQGLERLIAVDQYNGSVLWALEIPFMRRFNIPRDCANWCADENFVYVAVRDRVWKIDAATGEVLHFEVPVGELAGRSYDWGYLASQGNTLIGSAVRSGSSYDEFWGPSKWYDAIDGPDAAKVVSDKLFATSKSDGYELWQYQNGLINNATITISDSQVMFVETRNRQLMEAESRRIESKDLFQQQRIVALDAATGEPLWDKPLVGIDGTTMVNMAASDGVIVIVASHPKQFDITAVDATNGDTIWQSTAGWPGGRTDHGVHLSRPAIVGDRLFVRPLIFELSTGKQLERQFPVGGCGTYACSESALLFRSGSGGTLSIWSPKDDGYSHFTRVRTSCWLSTIPAGGMLLSPEGGGGCSCGNWMETSMGFAPKHLLE